MFTSDIFHKPGTEVSAEILKTSEAAETAETTTSLDSLTTSSPGRSRSYFGLHVEKVSA